MADATILEVVARERSGKGSARAARRAGLVPAVVYGDKKPSAMITMKKNELIKLFNRELQLIEL